MVTGFPTGAHAIEVRAARATPDSEAPPAVNTTMAELTTLALACERTRVVSFMFSLPAAHVYYRHLAANMNDDYHDTICHGDAGDQSNQPRIATGVRYAMRCLSEFLTKLKSTPHGASNLLDGRAPQLSRRQSQQDATDHRADHGLAPGSPLTELGLDAGRVTSGLTGVRV